MATSLFDLLPAPAVQREPNAPEPPPPPSPEQLAEQRRLIALEKVRLTREIQRREWAANPVRWAEDRLHDVLWSGQRQLLETVRDNRRTVAFTCHAIGKSFSAATLVGWWLDTHKPGEAFVVTTAPTGPQVQVILWKEIGRVFVRGNFPGRVNQTEWFMTLDSDGQTREEMVAIGRKPSDYSPSAFQGVHAPYVLVIVDEANGVRGQLWEQADSLIANDASKIVAIGNPDIPQGEFFEHCKPGSGWAQVQIGAFDSPNFTGEKLPASILRQLIGRTYVEEKRRKWAPRWYWIDKRGQCSDAERGVRVVAPADAQPHDANPLWYSKILGVFPERAETGGLIPLPWIKAAQMRSLDPALPSVLGVDPGAGGDETAVCHRRGGVYRILRTDHDPDTMSQCGKVVNDLRETGASEARIDKIGIGWGMVDRGKELRQPFVGVNVAEAVDKDEDSEKSDATDERFLNLKAQLWWNVREMFERGEVDIDEFDDELAAELASVRYEWTSRGKIKIADKRKDANGRPIASPNRAESLMLAAAPGELVKPQPEDAWVTF